MKSAWGAACVSVCAAGWLVCAACGGGSHPYTVQRYSPAGRCLEAQSAIDVVDGKSASTNCAAKCFLTKPQDGGTVKDTYVSSMCPPYPTSPIETGADVLPECREALAALARDDQCNPDGTSTHPPADAATD